MNELFAAKYDMLLTEFNRYVMTHPGFLADMPDQALVVLIDREDPEFTQYNLERAKALRLNDDNPNRPTAYVDVGKLAPIRSRLVAPRLLSQPPDILAAA